MGRPRKNQCISMERLEECVKAQNGKRPVEQWKRRSNEWTSVAKRYYGQGFVCRKKVIALYDFYRRRKDVSSDFPVETGDAEEAVRQKKSANEHTEEPSSQQQLHGKANEGDTNEHAARMTETDAEKRLRHDREEKRAFPADDLVFTKVLSEREQTISVGKTTYSRSESSEDETIETVDLCESGQADERKEPSPLTEHNQHQYSGGNFKHPAAPSTLQGKLSQHVSNNSSFGESDQELDFPEAENSREEMPPFQYQRSSNIHPDEDLIPQKNKVTEVSKGHSFTSFVSDLVTNVIVRCGKEFFFHESAPSDNMRGQRVLDGVPRPDVIMHDSQESFHNSENLPEVSNNATSTADGVFSKYGISSETANILGACNFPNTGTFHQPMDKKVFKLNVPVDFYSIPHRLGYDGRRQFTDEWTHILNTAIACVNPYCVWVFKGHYIKKAGSRKSSPFFTCSAFCKIKGCRCSVKIAIKNAGDSYADASFAGDIVHAIGSTGARQLRGKLRQEITDHFKKNPNIPPSNVYRDKLSSIPAKQFESGNRNAAASKKVFQNIKSEATKHNNTIKGMYAALLALQKKFRLEDEQEALSLGQGYRRIFGYIHTIEITNDEIKISLFTEGTVRIFHQLCRKDILYIDATGSFVNKAKSFKRIFNYCLALRHPLGKAPPLPLLEFISSSHTTDAVRSMLLYFREKENLIFGSRNIPKLIICDFSKVLIAAVLYEFNGETVEEYLARAFHIITGKATTQDLAKALIHVCSAHVIRNTKEVLRRKYPNDCSKVHFGMRIIGRMMMISDLRVCEKFLKAVTTVMATERVNAAVKEAANEIEESVATFSDLIIDDNDDDDHNNTGCRLEDVDEKQDDSDSGSGHLWKDYWEEKVPEHTDVFENATEMLDAPINKYHMPEFYSYLRRNLMPQFPLWSKIILQDLSVFDKESYDDYLQLPQSIGTNIWIKNQTNATVENVFKMKKADKTQLKVSIPYFVEKNWKEIKGLQRQFVDELCKADLGAVKKSGLSKADITNLCNISTSVTSETPKTIFTKARVPKEKFKHERKRKVEHDSFLSPPKTRKKFNPTATERSQLTVEEGKNPKKTNDVGSPAFVHFWSQNWKEVALVSPSISSMRTKLFTMWNEMDHERRHSFTIPSETDKEHCLCRKPYEADDSFMVACDKCNTWYHTKCISFNNTLAEHADYYLCKLCFNRFYRPIVHYISHKFSTGAVTANQSLSNTIAEVDEKSEMTKEVLREITFPADDDLITASESTKIAIYSKSGLANRFMNCWLNASLHVLLGTVLRNYLLRPEYKGFLIGDYLEDVAESISRLDSLEEEEGVSDAVQMLATEMKMPLETKTQHDSIEFYEYVVRAFIGRFPESPIGKIFTLNMFVTASCVKCGAVTGYSTEQLVTKIFLCKNKNVLPLQDLIWDCRTGKCSYEDNACGSCKDSKLFKEVVFTVENPTVCLFQIIRYEGPSTVTIKSKVSIPIELDVSGTSPSYDVNDYSTYVLFATVNFYGRTATSGHYVAHLFDNEKVLVCDDRIVTWKDTQELLCEGSFQQSVYAAFYVRKSAINASIKPQNVEPWLLNKEHRLCIERLWFSEEEKPGGKFLNSVVRSTANSKMLKNEILWAFLSSTARDTKYSTIVCSTWLFDAVQKGKLNQEYKHYVNDNTLPTKDILIIPVFHDGNPGHWTVVAVYQKIRLIVHMDSLHKISQYVFDTVLFFLRKNYIASGINFRYLDWTLVAPTEIPLQRDAVSCGVYACMNGYSAMKLEYFPYNCQNLPRIRYWLLHKALQWKNTRFDEKEKKGPIQGIEKPVSASRRVYTYYRCKKASESLFDRIKKDLEEKPTVTGSNDLDVEEGDERPAITLANTTIDLEGAVCCCFYLPF